MANQMTNESRILRDASDGTLTLASLLASAGLNPDEATALARRARVCSVDCRLSELADVQRLDIARVLESRARLNDPLSVDPFLAWCAQRESRILAGMEDDESANVGERLMFDLGWHFINGMRRLYRWRHPTQGEGHSGYVERAIIEDALDHAGVYFYDVYPLAARPRPVRVRLGEQRLMSDAEVIAAHTVYVRGRMTTTTLADLLWERFGYSSPGSCAKALTMAFRGLGLPVRRCDHITARGLPCERAPSAGIDQCAEHRPGVRPSHIGARVSADRRVARAFRPSPELIADARALHEDGLPFRAVGHALLARTPLGSADHLAQQLAAVAARQGWHRTARFGRARGGPVADRRAA